ncbi:hypothetical protein Tco_1405382 [Tanacetum coccineum]
MRIEESLNVTFDESLPEPKSSSSVEDDRIIEPMVQNRVRSPSLEANALEPGYPKSLKEARVSNGKLTHVGLAHVYMFVACIVLCLLVASCSQEHLEGNALEPWIPALEQGGACILGEMESKAKKLMIGKSKQLQKQRAISYMGVDKLKQQFSTKSALWKELRHNWPAEITPYLIIAGKNIYADEWLRHNWSIIMEIEPDIKNMTINEYLEYEAEKERRDTNHESGNLVNFPIFPTANEFASICEQDVDNINNLEKEEAQVEDAAEDYVAPATKSILDELLEEFEDEILNVTMVDDEADFNPTKDIEELERLLTKYPQSYFTEIQVLTARGWDSSYTGNANGVVLRYESSSEEAF